MKFVNWGYPSWFRFVVGALELICAVLLVIPDKRSRFVGAAGLVFILTGAVTTHIVNHDPISHSISSPLHLLIAAAFALANWRRLEGSPAATTGPCPPRALSRAAAGRLGSRPAMST